MDTTPPETNSANPIMTNHTSASPALLEADSAARKQALQLRSFIVEAPAGAGKTELITQRFLMLLGYVEHPEEIIAITFTRKAAAEMRSRILDSLSMAAAGTRPPEAHKQITFDLALQALSRSAERNWSLLAQPQRLRILTIDALCTSLARQMPLLSRFGAQPGVEQQADAFYLEAAEQTVALLQDYTCVSESLAWLDNDTSRLKRLIAEMLARRDQWLHHAHGTELAAESAQVLRRLVEEELAALSSQLPDTLQRELMPSARFAANQLGSDSPLVLLRDWMLPLNASADDLPHWRALCALLLTSDGNFRKTVNKNNGFPATDEGREFKAGFLALTDCLRAQSGVAEALSRIASLPLPEAHEDEAEIIEHLANLLRLAAAQLMLVFQQEGKVDFIEVAQRALQALDDGSGPSELALRLDYRLSHLLVDEFQDTSPTQVRLLELLTQGWALDDGRTLFCVGDPMQSIYRFRKADVGLFLQAAQNGIGDVALEPLRLSRNNRSSPEVIDWVNSAFAQVFPDADRMSLGAISYRSFVATRESTPGSGVQVHPLVLPAEISKAERDRIEAQTVLSLIDQARSLNPEGSIAVLVRARKHLSALIAEIRAHRPDLSFQAVEVEPLANRQWIADLMTITRALLQRADRIAWLAVLRAPFCGLTLADLYKLAADNRQATLWSLMQDEQRLATLSQDGQQRLAHVRSVFQQAYAHREHMPLARWIESVWLQLGAAALLPDAAASDDVQAWFALLARLTENGEHGLDKLEDEVARLYAAPDAAADGTLSFMTVHKSKGLEFDTVILPGLHRKAGQPDNPMLRWEEVVTEHTLELVVAPMRTRRNNEETNAFSYLAQLDKMRATHEDLRVLYVAATRAKKTLHWVGVAKAGEDDEACKPPEAGTALKLLWPVMEAGFAAAEPFPLTPSDDARPSYESFVPPLLRLRHTGQPALLRDADQQPPAVEQTQLEWEPAEIERRFRLEAAVGTLVHRYLELFAESGLTHWTPERIATLHPAMQRWFGTEGFASADAAKGTNRAQAMLNTLLRSQKAHWILAPRPQAASELALASRSGETLRLNIVDRCFIENGERWIIDYKTATLPDNADPEAFTRHARHYQPQLERYGALFADEGLPQRLAIYYVAHDVLQVV